MRRLALFSDIHGNLAALDAVLADIDAAGLADHVYCLGDLVGYGPRPGEVVERLRSLGTPTIRGNYDDGIGNRSGDCGCYYATEQAKADGAASYDFTARVLSDADKYWLRELPGELRLEADGVRILLVHGSPRRINEYLLPDRTDEQLARLADVAEADVVCVGHIHVPYHRALDAPDGRRIHYLSSGSVGKPKDGDPRACWVEAFIGDAEEVGKHCAGDASAGRAGLSAAWVGARWHRVEYDVDSVASEMLAAGLPTTLAEALRTA